MVVSQMKQCLVMMFMIMLVVTHARDSLQSQVIEPNGFFRGISCRARCLNPFKYYRYKTLCFNSRDLVTNLANYVLLRKMLSGLYRFVMVFILLLSFLCLLCSLLYKSKYLYRYIGSSSKTCYSDQ